jgi:tetratricopeptide (TPR) repeat protein
MGSGEKAVQLVERARNLAGNDVFYDWALAYVYACQGRREEAAQILESLERSRGISHFAPAFVASIAGALGEIDRAFAILEAAYEERDSFLAALKADPIFDPLRSDPRFGRLLQRIGLEAT